MTRLRAFVVMLIVAPLLAAGTTQLSVQLPAVVHIDRTEHDRD